MNCAVCGESVVGTDSGVFIIFISKNPNVPWTKRVFPYCRKHREESLKLSESKGV